MAEIKKMKLELHACGRAVVSQSSRAPIRRPARDTHVQGGDVAYIVEEELLKVRLQSLEVILYF